LIILNCEKYRHKALQQKEDWLKGLSSIPNLKWYHIIGTPESDYQYSFNDAENILYVKSPDDYLSLPKKVISAMKAVTARFDYKYIFKTDDDQKLIIPSFFKDLIQICERESRPHYGGFILKVPGHYSTYYTVHSVLPKDLFLEATTYVNGRFYFLSCPAVQNLLTSETEISKKIIEDHAIGYYLSDEFKKMMMFIPTSKIFIDYK
jgi:hypothetical protein